MPAKIKPVHIIFFAVLFLFSACAAPEAAVPVVSPEAEPAPEKDTGEYFGDMPAYIDEEPEPEPEIEFRETVASVTPDFIPEIRDKEKENPDTVGWLYIPDTTINDVVLKNPAGLEDNQYYLETGFDGLPNPNGTFCADYRDAFGDRGELSGITTIYGHSFSDDPEDKLFAPLKNYRNPDFARAHPYIFFSTGSENMVWEVFAVFDTSVDLPYITPDLSANYLYDVLDAVDRLSEYSYAEAPALTDKLLALSTCTFAVRGHPAMPEYNDYRFVVMAKLLPPEALKKDEAIFEVNKDCIPPDDITKLMRSWKKHSFPVKIF